jgi:hypothetical protein
MLVLGAGVLVMSLNLAHWFGQRLHGGLGTWPSPTKERTANSTAPSPPAADRAESPPDSR